MAPLHYKLLTSSCNASTLEWQQTLKWTIKELELHCQFNIGKSGDIFISWNLYLFVMCFREGLKKSMEISILSLTPPPKVWKIIFYFFFNSRPLLEIFLKFWKISQNIQRGDPWDFFIIGDFFEILKIFPKYPKGGPLEFFLGGTPPQ